MSLFFSVTTGRQQRFGRSVHPPRQVSHPPGVASASTSAKRGVGEGLTTVD
jgi:hypothetical protein